MKDIKIIRIPQSEYYTSIGYVVFRIDRATVVGNPFAMCNNGLEERDIVCDDYQEYFDKKIADAIDKDFMDYLWQIYTTAQKYPVALACWCTITLSR